MRRFALAAALFVAAGCGGAGGGGDGGTAKSVCPVTPRQISVALPNNWPGVDPEAFAQLLADSCQSITEIEALPYFDHSLPCCVEPYREQRRALLKAMSAHKVTTHIIPENSNAPKAWDFDEAWYRRYMTDLVADAHEAGTQYVWMSSPSEPDAFDQRRGLERAKITRELWDGVFVMPARTKPQIEPWFSGIPYDYLEVHPGSVEAALFFLRRPEPLLVVTDNGALLVPDDADLRNLTHEALRLDRPLIFYDYRALQPNVSAIGVVADEIVVVGG